MPTDLCCHEEALEAAQRVLDVATLASAREVALEEALADERARADALAAELDAAHEATAAARVGRDVLAERHAEAIALREHVQAQLRAEIDELEQALARRGPAAAQPVVAPDAWPPPVGDAAAEIALLKAELDYVRGERDGYRARLKEALEAVRGGDLQEFRPGGRFVTGRMERPRGARVTVRTSENAARSHGPAPQPIPPHDPSETVH